MNCCNMVCTWRWSCPTSNPTPQLQSNKFPCSYKRYGRGQTAKVLWKKKPKQEWPSRCAEAVQTSDTPCILYCYLWTWEWQHNHGVGTVEVDLVSIASHVSDSKSRMLRSSIRCLCETSPPNITKVEPTSVTDWPQRAIWTKENILT